MPKQQKKVIATEEVDESESDHVDSATDEEIESEAGDLEGDDSEEGESEDEEVGASALDASATESDEDDEDDDQDGDSDDDDEEEDEEMDVKKPKVAAESGGDDDEDDDDEDDEEVDDDEDVPKKKAPKTKGTPPAVPEYLVNNITKQITQAYENRKGLQLFIRLPEKLPEDFKELEEKMKLISPLIVKVHKPRQKHARFCLVDFASKADRDKVYHQLSEGVEESKLTVGFPKTEDDDFIKKLIEQKIKKVEKVRSFKILKKEGKKAFKQKTFTSNLVVFNIPKSASIAQIRELFPKAVDIQLKPAPKKFVGVCTAAVTCRSTQEASENQKRRLTLGGNKLIIRFDLASKKAKKDVQDSPAKGPAAPKGDKSKNKKSGQKAGKKGGESKPQLGKKRLSDGDGAEQVPEKKTKLAKTEKTNPPQKKQPTNGNAKAGKVKQNKQQMGKANGKAPQKKGGAKEANGQSPQKKEVPGKKPFVKKQQAQKFAAKKGKAAAK